MKIRKKILGSLIAGIMLVVPFCVYASEGWETPSGLDAKGFETYCDTYFEEKVKDEIPGASIVVVSDGKIVFEKGYGYSDVGAHKVPDPASTIYEYGSVSKLFTWVSLMQLYEQGKIDLNTDIKTYLPEDFKVPTSYDKPITVLDLMNHQAGFDDYLIHLFSTKDNMLSLRESLEEHKVEQIYEPGYASSYSNYGAGLAGYIVENVAHKPDYEYIKENIMGPCGMEKAVINPDIFSDQTLLDNKAKVYSKEGDGFKEQNWSIVSMYPAGGANGTVEELGQFAIALLDKEKHPLFSKRETIEALLTTSTDSVEGVAGIAHGFIEYDGEAKTYWHNGGTDHSSTFFAIVPEKNFGIALCSNIGSVDAIQNFAFDILKKRNVSLQQPEGPLPSTDEVEGAYLNFREAHSGITKMISLFRYLNPVKVTAINEDQIAIGGSVFKQVEPYIYQDIETGEKIAFSVEKGKVVKYSYMLDLLKVPKGKIVFAWLKIIILGLFIVSYLIAVVIVLWRVIRKKFQRDILFVIGSIVGWGAVICNLLSVANKFANWCPLNEFYSQLVLGRCLAVIIVGCDLLGIGSSIIVAQHDRKEEKRFIGLILLMHLILSLLAVIVMVSIGGFSVS